MEISLISVAAFSFSSLVNTCAIIIFFSSIDDFFIDLIYVSRRFYRWVWIYSRNARANAETLAASDRPQAAFAICIPTWKEDGVIAATLTRLVRDLRYTNYKVLVGTYSNDHATAQEIDALLTSSDAFAARVERVDVGHDGPTNKADCLNAIFAHMQTKSAWARARKPVACVLHDAEDVVHPFELSVFNYLHSRADVIQLPVLPLPQSRWNLVAGHYLDEFAETHAKDMVVRETLACPVPSAGVGCAISTRALGVLAKKTGNRPFNQSSVTEDYDVALDIGYLGFTSMFVRLPGRSSGSSYVATQEYFPDTFGDAVKQKSRWLLGIALESWNKRGWQGGLRQRYMLWRDRKSVLTSIITVLSYSLLLIFLSASALSHLNFPASDGIKLMPESSFIKALLWTNFGLLTLRILTRFAFVFRAYGFAHAAMVPGKIIMGNAVNFCAAVVAIRQFVHAQNTGTQTAWAKTCHQVPSLTDVLPEPGVRLGN